MKRKTYYYACLECRDGTVIKIPYEKREDARDHIASKYNSDDYKSCWTE